MQIKVGDMVRNLYIVGKHYKVKKVNGDMITCEFMNTIAEFHKKDLKKL